MLLQSTPPVTPALKARLSRYSGVRAATLTGLSDDGQALLCTTRFSQTAQLHRVTRPGGRREQLTFRAEPVRGGQFVPGDPGSVVFRTGRGGGGQYQLLRLDLRTRQAERLTDGRSRTGVYLLCPLGQRILFTGNARNGRDMDLYLADLARPGPGQARPYLERQGTWVPLDWSRDGLRVILLEYRSINDSRLHLLDVQSRQVTPITTGDRPASHRRARFSSDGKKAYVTSDRDGEFVALYEVDLQGMIWTPLTPALRWNVEGLAVSPEGRAVVFAVNEGGTSVLHRLDPSTRRHAPLSGVPAGIISGLRFARSAPVLGFTLRGPTLAGDAYTIDLGASANAAVRWTFSELGGLVPETLVSPELVHYPTFDGRQIPAFYYNGGTARRAKLASASPQTPKKRTGKAGSAFSLWRFDGPQIPAFYYNGGTARRAKLASASPHTPKKRTGKRRPSPVLVWIHGGPESQARPGLNPLLQYLVNESGIAVIQPNVRGSDGYGKSYLRLDNGRLREDAVKDIGALLDWIATRPELDARRVAVMGGSYGGYMTLASLVHFGPRLRAGISLVGISNFVTFLENTMPYRRDLRRAEYGDERDPGMRAFLERISPLTHAHRIRSALFVAQGATDPRVPLSEAEQIVKAVRSHGQEVWFMVARSEGHGFARQENRSLYFALSVLFLEKHLGIHR